MKEPGAGIISPEADGRPVGSGSTNGDNVTLSQARQLIFKSADETHTIGGLS